MAAEVITPLSAGGPQFRPPEGITASHDVSEFSCRRDELNAWLRRRALTNEGKTSRTYVVALGARVVAYYTLAAGSVSRDEIPRSIRHDTPETVPIVVLGRLATDKNFERRGLGQSMLQEAISRVLVAAAEIGVRGLLVHAIDDDAAGFYRKFRFVNTPIGERTFLLPVETARNALLAR